MRSVDKRYKEVPEVFAGLLKFPNNRVASFTVSFGAANRSTFEVTGTEGTLKIDSAYDLAEDLRSELSIGDWKVKEIFRKPGQFASELVYFSDCVLNDIEPEPSGRMGLADVRIIRALLQSAETNRPVAILQPNANRHPDLNREPVTNPVINRLPLTRINSSAAD